MDEHPSGPAVATAVLTRLFLAADRLGIDVAALQSRVSELVPALGGGAWASLDSDNRLAIRCAQGEDGPGRPLKRQSSDAMRFELEQCPDGHVAETTTASGRRSFAEDRALLMAAGVSDQVTLQLRDFVDQLATDGRCDAIARRNDHVGESWIASIAFEPMAPGEAALELRETTKDALVRLANGLGVHTAQIDILVKMHWFAHHGFSVSFQFGADGIVPVLMVEYANIPWITASNVAKQLRPVPPQPARLGVFAGAFDAPQAASLQLAYIPSGVARVRVSVDAA